MLDVWHAGWHARCATAATAIRWRATGAAAWRRRLPGALAAGAVTLVAFVIACAAGVLALPGVAQAVSESSTLDFPYRIPPPAPDQAQVESPPALPFYIATKGETTIYLLGTLHAGKPADYPSEMPFRLVILAALHESQTVAFELSPDDLVASQGEVERFGVCARSCLPQQVSASLWRQIVARLRGNPEALTAVRHARPWLAALLIETIDAQSAGLQSEYGTESQIENIYLGRIVGLETLNEQMQAFTGLTFAEQREMLEQAVAQSSAQDVDDIRTLRTLWRQGDANRLAAWEVAQTARLAHSLALSDAIDDRIVYQRNRRLAVRILLLAAPRKPLFVAIGALHLGGSRGVLELLKTYGYDVRRD